MTGQTESTLCVKSGRAPRGHASGSRHGLLSGTSRHGLPERPGGRDFSLFPGASGSEAGIAGAICTRSGGAAVLWLFPYLIVACSFVAADSAEDILADLARSMSLGQMESTVSCRISAPEIRDHRAHGTLPLDMVRNVALENSRVTYNLRYWMNIPAAGSKRGVAIEGTTGVGMDRPSKANWYSNNFLELTVGDVPILRNAIAVFEPLPPRKSLAGAVIRWETEQADVGLTVSLGKQDSFLVCSLKIVSKVQPKPVRLGFRAYPGDYPPPRRRIAMTLTRELHAPASAALGPRERKVVLFDETKPRAACAIDATAANCDRVTIDVQNYPVTLWMEFPAAQTVQSGPVKLWDFADTSLNDVMEKLFEPDHGAQTQTTLQDRDGAASDVPDLAEGKRDKKMRVKP